MILSDAEKGVCFSSELSAYQCCIMNNNASLDVQSRLFIWEPAMQVPKNHFGSELGTLIYDRKSRKMARVVLSTSFRKRTLLHSPELTLSLTIMKTFLQFMEDI
jgi:hypothetical protein